MDLATGSPLARIRACPVSQVPCGRTWYYGVAIGGYLVPFLNDPAICGADEPVLVELIACPVTYDHALRVGIEVSPGRSVWFDMRNWKGGPDEKEYPLPWPPPPSGSWDDWDAATVQALRFAYGASE